MRSFRVARMVAHPRRATIRQWHADLRAAGALPWIAREIVRDMYAQCETWEDMERAMPQVIQSARDGGVRNGRGPERTQEAS